MKEAYPKNFKRLLHEWKAEAHERELCRELTKLDRYFAQWRVGEIGSGELSIRVHEYEVGPSRELFKRYNNGQHDFNVAYAIVTGILGRDEVPAEILEALERHLAFYQSMMDRGELKMPGE